MLRDSFGITNQYIESLSRCQPLIATGGKSGATFFKTQNDAIILKELCVRWTSLERNALLSFAPKYFIYFAKRQAETLLAKIYGFYQVKFKTETFEFKMDINVIQNLFFDQAVSSIFDLKGVSGRYSKSKSLFHDGDCNSYLMVRGRQQL